MQTKSTSTRTKQAAVLALQILGLCFFADVLIVRLLPRLIAWAAGILGTPLSSADLVTKYEMGFAVRVIGILLALGFMQKLRLLNRFSCKLIRQDVLISWMLFIYILANFEFCDFSNVGVVPVACMMLETMAIGFFEEIVFRGAMLALLIKALHGRKNGTAAAALVSSAIFGLSHFSNLAAGAAWGETCVQAAYTFILGVAFSALVLRTRGNLAWCGFLHGLYDMASGFGDFAAASAHSQAVAAAPAVSLASYVLDVAMFLPLLFYGLYLLRKPAACTLAE